MRISNVNLKNLLTFKKVINECRERDGPKLKSGCGVEAGFGGNPGESCQQILQSLNPGHGRSLLLGSLPGATWRTPWVC